MTEWPEDGTTRDVGRTERVEVSSLSAQAYLQPYDVPSSLTHAAHHGQIDQRRDRHHRQLRPVRHAAPQLRHAHHDLKLQVCAALVEQTVAVQRRIVWLNQRPERPQHLRLPLDRALIQLTVSEVRIATAAAFPGWHCRFAVTPGRSRVCSTELR